LPRDFLDHFQIKRRVQVEVTEMGILIRAPKTEHAEQAPMDEMETTSNKPSIFTEEHAGLEKFARTFTQRIQIRVPAWLKRRQNDSNEGER
jgi:hypothetical protein